MLGNPILNACPNLDGYGSLGVKKVDAAIRFDKIRRITPYTFIGPSGQLKWLNGQPAPRRYQGTRTRRRTPTFHRDKNLPSQNQRELSSSNERADNTATAQSFSPQGAQSSISLHRPDSTNA